MDETTVQQLVETTREKLDALNALLYELGKRDVEIELVVETGASLVPNFRTWPQIYMNALQRL